MLIAYYKNINFCFNTWIDSSIGWRREVLLEIGCLKSNLSLLLYTESTHNQLTKIKACDMSIKIVRSNLMKSYLEKWYVSGSLKYHGRDTDINWEAFILPGTTQFNSVFKQKSYAQAVTAHFFSANRYINQSSRSYRRSEIFWYTSYIA